MALAVLLSYPVCLQADENVINYSELFARVLTTDGAYAEKLSDDIGNAFDQSPTDFLEALVSESAAVQDHVIMLLIYSQYVETEEVYSAFHNTVLRISEDTAVSDDIKMIAGQILEEMSTFLTQGDEKEPASETIIDDAEYAFDKKTIENLIQLNLPLKNTDEGFFHTISQAYQASPVAFASLISDYSDADILYLAKGISYDYQKYGVTDTFENEYLGDDVSVAQALNIIRTQIAAVNNSGLLEEQASMPVEIPEEKPDMTAFWWITGAAVLAFLAVMGAYGATKAKKR